MVKIAEELERYKKGEISAEDLWDKLRWNTHQVKEVAVEEYRWQILYNWVVQDEENRYWSFGRLMDKGEMGEHEDFDPSCIQEVEPYEKTIIDYRPILKDVEVKNG